MWCRRRRPRRRKPPGLEKVPATWWCRTRHLTSPRRSPLVKTRRRNKKSLPPPARGEKKKKATPAGEAEGSRKRKTPPPDYSHDAEEGREERPYRTKRPAK